MVTINVFLILSFLYGRQRIVILGRVVIQVMFERKYSAKTKERQTSTSYMYSKAELKIQIT